MGLLRIITGFDGACPFSEAGINSNPDGSFEVRPSWRPAPGISEEAPGMGSRFSIRVENSSGCNQPFKCFINWQDEQQVRLRFHDWVTVLFPEAPEWEMFPAELDKTGAHILISLPPGTTHIGMSPYYGYGMAVDYLKSKSEMSGVTVATIGQTRENRDIPVLVINAPEAGRNKEKIMVMARNHAYESSGSFCIEGMIDFLLSENELARYFRAVFEFYFLPMTNPDGVYNGMSRLTSPKGADLNRCCEQDAPAWRALKEYLDKVRPAMFMNIHNWMDKSKDGLFANTAHFAAHFKRLMPDLREDGYYWHVEHSGEYLRRAKTELCGEEAASWKDYVRDNFGAVGMTLEFPWFNRNTARMRKIGETALKAFLRAEKY